MPLFEMFTFTRSPNLIDFENFEVLEEKKFDVIFLRNVFIYFSLDISYTYCYNIKAALIGL